MADKSGSDSSTKTDAPVAARAAVDEAEPKSQRELLEKQAKEQEKLQSEQLRDGKKNAHVQPGDSPPEVRANAGTAHSKGPQGGFVDGMSRRDASDALEGHYVVIDRTHKGVDEDLLPEGQDGYGVYVSPASVGDDGYPDVAIVQLRDDSHAIIRVPYESLRPVAGGGRR